jgi:hypothetical protein
MFQSCIVASSSEVKEHKKNAIVRCVPGFVASDALFLDSIMHRVKALHSVVGS